MTSVRTLYLLYCQHPHLQQQKQQLQQQKQHIEIV